MKTKKIIALALASLMCLSVLAGCSSSDTSTTDTTTDAVVDTTTDSSTEETEEVEAIEEELVAYTSTTSETGVTSTSYDAAVAGENVAFTYDGGEILADVFAYGLNQGFYTLTSTYTDTTTEFDYEANFDIAKASAIDYLLQIVAIDQILAENNYEMTVSLADSIEADIVYAEEQMGTETFYETLATMGISRDGFKREQLRVYAFEEAVDAIYGKSTDELYESYENDYFKVQHILFAFEYNDDGTISEESRATALENAQIALDAYNNGEKTFEELIEEYSEDTTQPTKGYAFKSGYMLEEFEAIALGLAEGEVSDISEVSYGVHIMRAIPSSLENFEANAENIEYIEYYENGTIATDALYERIDLLSASLVSTDLGASITNDNYKDYLITE